MNAERNISETLFRLRSFYRGSEPAEQFGSTVLRWLEDPLRPRTNRIHLNPILLVLLTLFVLTVGTFLIFSFVQ
jgi:hypothetical protein